MVDEIDEMVYYDDDELDDIAENDEIDLLLMIDQVWIETDEEAGDDDELEQDIIFEHDEVEFDYIELVQIEYDEVDEHLIIIENEVVIEVTDEVHNNEVIIDEGDDFEHDEIELVV